MRVELTTELQAGVEPLRVGARGSARRFAVLSPDFAVEVSADWSVFEEAMLWRGWLAIGLGEFVHLVNLETHGVVSLSIDGYFSKFYALDDSLLVASATRVWCLEPDGATRWVSEVVAVDGVVFSEVKDGVVEGDGEWDPPGGWRPFRLSLATGNLA